MILLYLIFIIVPFFLWLELPQKTLISQSNYFSSRTGESCNTTMPSFGILGMKTMWLLHNMNIFWEII